MAFIRAATVRERFSQLGATLPYGRGSDRDHLHSACIVAALQKTACLRRYEVKKPGTLTESLASLYAFLMPFPVTCSMWVGDGNHIVADRRRKVFGAGFWGRRLLGATVLSGGKR